MPGVMNRKVLDLEKFEIIICSECGSDHLTGLWYGNEEFIDLKCHDCGAILTNKKNLKGESQFSTKEGEK